MGTGLKIFVAIVGTITTFIWLYLVKVSNGLYNEQIEEIDKEEYFLPELFQIGFYIIEKFNINMSLNFFRKKREKLLEVKGEDAADFYLYVIFAGQLSYALTIIPIGFMFSLLADSFEISVFAIILSALLAYYLEYEIENLVESRHDALLRELPNVLSKMSLLINAGMILRDAWAQISSTSDRLLYQEMKTTEYEMNNGWSDNEALSNFAKRCNIKEIKKFISVIEQNLEKGNSELAKALRELSDESWNEKKQIAIQKGAAVDSKLLIPTSIIFMGILIIIIIPLFSNMF